MGLLQLDGVVRFVLGAMKNAFCSLRIASEVTGKIRIGSRVVGGKDRGKVCVKFCLLTYVNGNEGKCWVAKGASLEKLKSSVLDMVS